jgi:hypothetical protein
MALIGSDSAPSLGGGGGSKFRDVLSRLASDKGYLAACTATPTKILQDYPDLTLRELDALRDAAFLSGVDMTSINPLHEKISGFQLAQTQLGGDINGCCCCCCCGVTGQIIRR